VSSTVEVGLADPHTDGGLQVPLVAERSRRCAAASTRDIDNKVARATVAGVTLRLAGVSAA
jgi:hypothetical protein